MTLRQGYYKTFYWKTLMFMKNTPILDQAMLNPPPPKVGERFNIHSKILKKKLFPICFELRKKGRYLYYCPPN